VCCFVLLTRDFDGGVLFFSSKESLGDVSSTSNINCDRGHDFFFQWGSQRKLGQLVSSDVGNLELYKKSTRRQSMHAMYRHYLRCQMSCILSSLCMVGCAPLPCYLSITGPVLNCTSQQIKQIFLHVTNERTHVSNRHEQKKWHATRNPRVPEAVANSWRTTSTDRNTCRQ
jgi:hypothetical protein